VLPVQNDWKGHTLKSYSVTVRMQQESKEELRYLGYNFFLLEGGLKLEVLYLNTKESD